ncbi:uncharacterized protein LOC106181963 [Lingula anatina]|uniref:Uncharacterized protein LOC106181963 n=1 Tax=Lingula anatina TaxID=7574 RepID=A0A1S3KIF2_LINAN|nr:uncharacterized protein LOC106181963 [Lingula anatina]XP_013421992.1 uncharacterized protein LOC106181963 [Lingula anatina]XP_013421994.1 uncharacterized protein LOC106181963 [Lingula anatina]XP_013421995.1 uncharacterized protein LOC106181963 [Lingula anatina]|eukprot:XP_013421991.1 uncharacterized protein LOC106181963 [Lingula anatina]
MDATRPEYIHNHLSLDLKNEITRDQFKAIKQLLWGTVGRAQLEEAEDVCHVFNLMFDKGIISIGEYGVLKRLVRDAGIGRLVGVIEEAENRIRTYKPNENQAKKE